MFNPLGAMKNLGDMNKLRQQAMELQRQLAGQTITVERNGVKVTMTGDQRLTELVIDGQLDSRIMEVLNEAIRKSQQTAAQKLAAMTG